MPESIEINVNIGKAIKKGLQAKGWTQKKLAEAMGVSSALVSGWIKNNKTPMGDDLIKIALLLEIVPLLFPTNRPFDLNNEKLQITAEVPEEVQDELERVWKEINSLKKLVKQ